MTTPFVLGNGRDTHYGFGLIRSELVVPPQPGDTREQVLSLADLRQRTEVR